jgi:hypothetical protein
VRGSPDRIIKRCIYGRVGADRVNIDKEWMRGYELALETLRSYS